MDKKLACIKAHKSQFFDPSSKEPKTLISSQTFFDSITARDQEMGRVIDKPYAEGFNISRPIGVRNLFDLI